MRCTVIVPPSWISVKAPWFESNAAAMMCTSCPRLARPEARRSANLAAPFMSGGNVSAPMTIFSGLNSAEVVKEILSVGTCLILAETI